LAVIGTHVLGEGSPNFDDHFQIWLTFERVVKFGEVPCGDHREQRSKKKERPGKI